MTLAMIFDKYSQDLVNFVSELHRIKALHSRSLVAFTVDFAWGDSHLGYEHAVMVTHFMRKGR